MSKRYIVYVEVEEYDSETDQYSTVDTGDLAVKFVEEDAACEFATEVTRLGYKALETGEWRHEDWNEEDLEDDDE